jgi:hypothetical protein
MVLCLIAEKYIPKRVSKHELDFPGFEPGTCGLTVQITLKANLMANNLKIS